MASKPNKVTEEVASPSLQAAKKGVRTSTDFATMMASLMSDVIEGKVTPRTANAACNAGGKLLKMVELQMKYGTPQPQNERKVLDLLNPGQPA